MYLVRQKLQGVEAEGKASAEGAVETVTIQVEEGHKNHLHSGGKRMAASCRSELQE